MRVSRVTIPICHIIWLVISVSVNSEDSCPESFMEDSPDVCVHYSDIYLGYCEAHRHCYQLGETVGGRGFIAGKYYQNRIDSDIPTSWTGLHRLSSDLGVESNSWSVTDPHSIGEFIREKEEGIIIRNNLPEKEKRILAASFNTLYTSLTTDSGFVTRNQVLCQVSGFGEKRMDPPAVELFKRDSSHDTHLSSNRIHGCMNGGTATTKMACAMRCKLNPKCRSFAYHPDTEECIIHEYIPSKLNSDVEPKDGKWERFVRPGW